MQLNKAEQVQADLMEVLRSNVSSNELSRRAGISLSSISRLRSGKASLDNLTLHNAIKLYDVIASIEEKKDLK